MTIYVWVLLAALAAVALALIVWFGLAAGWALVLRRMSNSIRSWDELEPEDAEPQR